MLDVLICPYCGWEPKEGVFEIINREMIVDCDGCHHPFGVRNHDNGTDLTTVTMMTKADKEYVRQTPARAAARHVKTKEPTDG